MRVTSRLRRSYLAADAANVGGQCGNACPRLKALFWSLARRENAPRGRRVEKETRTGALMHLARQGRVRNLKESVILNCS